MTDTIWHLVPSSVEKGAPVVLQLHSSAGKSEVFSASLEAFGCALAVTQKVSPQSSLLELHTAALTEFPERRLLACVSDPDNLCCLQDEFNKLLNARGNDPSTSCVRQNKGQAREALQRSGAESVISRITDDVEEALIWFSHAKHAVVIKPPEGCGSVGVFCCKTAEDIRKVFIHFESNPYQLVHKVGRWWRRWQGFISADGDVEGYPQAKTIDEALSACVHLGQECIGLTLNEADEPAGRVMVWLKRKFDFYADAGWISYEKINEGEAVTQERPQNKDLLLLERFLDGPQYVVNTVSCGGTHLVVELWHSAPKVQTDAGGFIYDRQDLLQTTACPRISSFVKGVLDSLGFRLGAAHLEIADTSTGLAVIEVNPRAGPFLRTRGAGISDWSTLDCCPDLLKRSANQQSVLAFALGDPDGFSALADAVSNSTHFKPDQFNSDPTDSSLPLSMPNVCCVFLCASQSGVMSAEGLAALVDLRTFDGFDRQLFGLEKCVPGRFDLREKVLEELRSGKLNQHVLPATVDAAVSAEASAAHFQAINQRVSQTDSLFTCPGVVVLRHSSPEAIEEDYRKIRAMEAPEGLLFNCRKED